MKREVVTAIMATFGTSQQRVWGAVKIRGWMVEGNGEGNRLRNEIIFLNLEN